MRLSVFKPLLSDIHFTREPRPRHGEGFTPIVCVKSKVASVDLLSLVFASRQAAPFASMLWDFPSQAAQEFNKKKKKKKCCQAVNEWGATALLWPH